MATPSRPAGAPRRDGPRRKGRKGPNPSCGRCRHAPRSRLGYQRPRSPCRLPRGTRAKRCRCSDSMAPPDALLDGPVRGLRRGRSRPSIGCDTRAPTAGAACKRHRGLGRLGTSGRLADLLRAVFQAAPIGRPARTERVTPCLLCPAAGHHDRVRAEFSFRRRAYEDVRDAGGRRAAGRSPGGGSSGSRVASSRSGSTSGRRRR